MLDHLLLGPVSEGGRWVHGVMLGLCAVLLLLALPRRRRIEAPMNAEAHGPLRRQRRASRIRLFVLPVALMGLAYGRASGGRAAAQLLAELGSMRPVGVEVVEGGEVRVAPLDPDTGELRVVRQPGRGEDALPLRPMQLSERQLRAMARIAEARGEGERTERLMAAVERARAEPGRAQHVAFPRP